ncbi:hypothetical protein Peur_068398 [Populus x canadensis]
MLIIWRNKAKREEKGYLPDLLEVMKTTVMLMDEGDGRANSSLCCSSTFLSFSFSVYLLFFTLFLPPCFVLFPPASPAPLPGFCLWFSCDFSPVPVVFFFLPPPVFFFGFSLCLIPCSAASGSGGWLLKTVKTMVNASSRLCAFVRWCFYFSEFASPFVPPVRLLYSICIGKRTPLHL